MRVLLVYVINAYGSFVNPAHSKVPVVRNSSYENFDTVVYSQFSGKLLRLLFRYLELPFFQNEGNRNFAMAESTSRFCCRGFESYLATDVRTHAEGECENDPDGFPVVLKGENRRDSIVSNTYSVVLIPSWLY